jgi:N6-adenosine-specific RNA methylase IME4
LGLEAIRCIIVEGDDPDEALLIEIDENLVRAGLSPVEDAVHLAKRKEIYERRYPETKHGAVGRRGKKSSQNANSFADDTAARTGRHKATISRGAARAKAIPKIAEARGTSLDEGVVDALAKLSERQQEELIERAKAGEKVSAKTALKKAQRTDREVELAAKQRALPERRYGVILADPEWQFEPYSRETGMDRSADNHYPTSPTDGIAARNVHSIAADDCVLFLWATAPMLCDALVVMKAWGFEYKTHVVWAKRREGDGRGTGYWFLGEHELLLVGTKGSPPAPAPGTQWGSVIQAPVGRHSEKPEKFITLIETLFPNLPKIELNRRGPQRPGWDAWGNEAETEIVDA